MKLDKLHGVCKLLAIVGLAMYWDLGTARAVGGSCRAGKPGNLTCITAVNHENAHTTPANHCGDTRSPTRSPYPFVKRFITPQAPLLETTTAPGTPAARRTPPTAPKVHSLSPRCTTVTASSALDYVQQAALRHSTARRVRIRAEYTVAV
jgi:hypothetical protein